MEKRVLEKFQKLEKEALLGGGKEKADAQRKKGKNTARDRLKLLLDKDSFVELDRFVTHTCAEFGMQDKKILGDGVVTGHGTIWGKQVYVFAHDFTVFGGSLGEAFAKKVCKIMDLALEQGCPIIGLNDSGGARIQEGVVSLGGYAEIFHRNVKASGVVPQISLILGPCAGGAVYSPAITDFIVMAEKTSHMFITGPEVVKAVTHTDVTFEELGGAQVHASKSGVAHQSCASEEEAIRFVRNLMKYLPQNNTDRPTPKEAGSIKEISKLNSLLPDDAQKPYDMKTVISYIVDADSFLELQKEYAKNIVIGFAHLEGHSVGVIANNPMHLAGTLDSDASVKAARFIRFCDSFNIPLLTFVDVPGFLPGLNQEHGGIIRHGAKLLYAFSEATVPKLTIITRKAYGGAYDVMSSKHIGADFNIAWPNAELAVMGPEGACNIIFKKEIEEAHDQIAKRKELIQYYRDTFASPYVAASRGYVDDIIEPAKTRIALVRALRSLLHKKVHTPKKKHGNIPL